MDIIQRLISNDPSGLSKDMRGDIPLHYAAQHAKDVNSIHQLLFVSDHNSLNDCGRTSLMTYSFWRKKNYIELNNVTHHINLQDIDGLTAIHYCFRDKNYEAIELLLSSGADPFIQHNRGKSSYDLSD